MYIIITGDIIKSRKIEEIDTLLKKKLHRVNEMLEDDIASKFNSSRGDEIQGIFYFNKRIFRNIRRLRYELLPMKFRMGVSIGELDKVDRENSWNMNGELFHQARQALDEISKENEMSTYIVGKYSKLNPYFVLADMWINDWTEKKWEAFILYEKYGTIEEAAKKIGITIQSLHQRLKSVGYKKIIKAEKMLVEEIFEAEVK